MARQRGGRECAVDCGGPEQLKAKFHYTIARDLARELVRELVCDLLGLKSIMLSRSQTWSQTWFSTCHRQVRAISTCQDSSNLVADRFKPYSIMLSCSATSSRAEVRSYTAVRAGACSRAGPRLDSVMEFGLRHEHDVHTRRVRAHDVHTRRALACPAR